MTSELAVDPAHVSIALESIDGDTFEAFAQSFYSAIRGTDYVPLGGMHDGGAEGFVVFASKLDVAAGSPVHFMQASVQQDPRKKIRKTVKRLREFGREPESVTYFTSLVVRNIDNEEFDLGKELDVSLRIRDRKYIESHINDSIATRVAFHTHLAPKLTYLRSAGQAAILAHSDHVTSPDAYVFLRQELERQKGNTSLIDAVIDSLALYGLEGSDPDAGKLMSQDQVRARICEAVPSAEQIVSVSRLNDRLQKMAGKDYPGGRAVRWHKKENLYSLPFETRQRLEAENTEDMALHVEVRDGLVRRIEEAYGGQLDAKEIHQCADICMNAVAATFEREGISFSHFLTRKPDAGGAVTIEETVDALIHERGVSPEHQVVVHEAAMQALNGCFYGSTEAERLYLSKLSQTYAILFTLQSEPRLVEYFQEMTGNFYLYVGSDVIVRALSERHVVHENRMTRIMLRMAREAGATLVLTEPVLDEVLHHMRASDTQFRNEFEKREAHLKVDITRHIDKILIRAYFYARFLPEKHVNPPKSWQGYIQQFLDYADLHKPAGKSDLRAYLQGEFGFDYVTRNDLEAMVDEAERHELAERFMEVKSKDVLAKNDALMTLGVYGRREERGESGKGSEFGYRTWWLTGESHIIKPAAELVAKKEDKRFMMRPEFLLNFIALAPSAAQVRETYRKVFPSLQGIRLGKRMSEDAFHQLMDDVDAAAELEDGRRQAEMNKISDRLKGDFAKKYTRSIDQGEERVTTR